MNITSADGYILIKDPTAETYYKPGDVLLHRTSNDADPVLWFIHAHTNQILNKTLYSDITGIVSADIDDFITQWLTLNIVSTGITEGDSYSGGAPYRVLFIDVNEEITTSNKLRFEGGYLYVDNNGVNTADTYLRLGQGGSTAILINTTSSRFAGTVSLDSHLQGYSMNDTRIRTGNAASKIAFQGSLADLVAYFLNDGGLGLVEQSTDPADPAEGECVMWMSDGTDSGDAGDIYFKITSGAVTKLIPLIDFSLF